MARDREEYLALWDAFGFPSPPPDVDSERYLVVAFVQPSRCGPGQFTSDPVTQLRVTGDGALTPKYAGPAALCFMLARYQPCTGTAYAVAVRRDRVPAFVRVVLDLERPPLADADEWLATHVPDDPGDYRAISPAPPPIERVTANEVRAGGLEVALGVGFQTSSGGQIGPEARLTGWFDRRPADPYAQFMSARSLLLGSGLGVSLHARALEPTSGDSKSHVQLGASVVLRRSERHSHWVFPTLLGLVLPEGGVAIESGRRFGYVAWSLPVSYRALHPAWRQFPTRISDWFGIELEPQLVWYPAEKDLAWSAGSSVSVVVW